MKAKHHAELQDIHKIFETSPDGLGSVQRFTALDGVSLTFYPGEIHTILGENGAGKSTLVHILSGLHQPSHGCVMIDGKELCFNSPSQALSAGIAMVHQRPLLSNEISVLENVILGSKGIFLKKSRRRLKVEAIAKQWNIRLDLGGPTRYLSAADRLNVALLGALFGEPDFLILDEPTAAMNPEDREPFFLALRRASAGGLGIILITHKLDEAARWSDRVSVLRKGKLTFSSPAADPIAGQELTETMLAELLDPLAGSTQKTRTQVAALPKEGTNAGSATLRLSGITVKDTKCEPLFDVSFTARPYGITGIFALPGSGLETLEDILSGMQTADAGTIAIGDTILAAHEPTPRVLRSQGISVVPSNRAFRGSHPDLTIFDMLTVYRQADFFPHREMETGFVTGLLKEAMVDVPPSRFARTLSGGQLQRLILAREISTNPRILILSDPEWGLDISGTALLRQRLKLAAAGGMTIVVLTDDLDSMHDTDFYSDVLRLREGRLT